MSQIYFTPKALEVGSYEDRIIKQTDPVLLANFFKVAEWIKENCPHLTATFFCHHQVYHKTHLIVEDGVAYLCYGSHSAGYEWKLSVYGTDYYTQGSCQSRPYRYVEIFGMRNDVLEEFLSQWGAIKIDVLAKNSVQSNVFSESFEP